MLLCSDRYTKRRIQAAHIQNLVSFFAKEKIKYKITSTSGKSICLKHFETHRTDNCFPVDCVDWGGYLCSWQNTYVHVHTMYLCSIFFGKYEPECRKNIISGIKNINFG